MVPGACTETAQIRPDAVRQPGRRARLRRTRAEAPRMASASQPIRPLQSTVCRRMSATPLRPATKAVTTSAAAAGPRPPSRCRYDDADQLTPSCRSASSGSQRKPADPGDGEGAQGEDHKGCRTSHAGGRCWLPCPDVVTHSPCHVLRDRLNAAAAVWRVAVTLPRLTAVACRLAVGIPSFRSVGATIWGPAIRPVGFILGSLSGQFVHREVIPPWGMV